MTRPASGVADAYLTDTDVGLAETNTGRRCEHHPPMRYRLFERIPPDNDALPHRD